MHGQKRASKAMSVGLCMECKKDKSGGFYHLLVSYQDGCEFFFCLQ